MSIIGVPLISWDLIVALWHARGLIAAIGFAVVFWFWLARRRPYVAVFLIGLSHAARSGVGEEE
jgi:hypothetical protein